MLGLVIYSLTAAVAIFGYEFTHFSGIPRPGFDSDVARVVPGSVVLLVAGLLNLWKTRLSGFVAHFGLLLIWSVLLSPVMLAYWKVMFFYFDIPYLLPVAFTTLLAVFSTLYAATAASGAIALALPLRFPLPHSDRNLEQAPPSAVKLAAGLLYFWIGMNTAIVIARIVLANGGRQGYATWLFLYSFVMAILFIVLQASKGKSWARIVLLLMVIWGGINLAPLLWRPEAHRPGFVLECLAFAAAVAAVILLFSAGSRPWFKHTRVETSQ